MNSHVCTCGRPRYSAADLERWNREFGLNVSAKEPDWARAICWTKPECACLMKPITTKDA